MKNTNLPLNQAFPHRPQAVDGILHKYGAKTVGEALKLSDQDLLRARGVGLAFIKKLRGLANPSKSRNGVLESPTPPQAEARELRCVTFENENIAKLQGSINSFLQLNPGITVETVQMTSIVNFDRICTQVIIFCR